MPLNTPVEDLLTRNAAIVWKIARSFADQESDCEDLAQEIFATLWSARTSIPRDVKESTYVYRVALNRAISLQRRESTYARHLRQFFLGLDRVATNAEHDDNDAELQALYSAIHQLRPLDRSLILMWLEDQSYAAMSDVTGLSESAVGKRLSRARQLLARKLETKGT